MKINKFKNNTKKLFNDFLKEYNVNKNITKQLLKDNKELLKDCNYGYAGYIHIMKNSFLYYEWVNYYLMHSIEYKTFLRYIKENNLYIQYRKYRKLKNFNNINFGFLDTFNWDNTEEGVDFWYNANSIWKNFLCNLSIVIYEKNYV